MSGTNGDRAKCLVFHVFCVSCNFNILAKNLSVETFPRKLGQLACNKLVLIVLLCLKVFLDFFESFAFRLG